MGPIVHQDGRTEPADNDITCMPAETGSFHLGHQTCKLQGPGTTNRFNLYDDGVPYQIFGGMKNSPSSTVYGLCWTHQTERVVLRYALSKGKGGKLPDGLGP